jgi:hypothetical protein
MILDTLLFGNAENTDNTDADEPPFIANNETILNVEPVSESVCWWCCFWCELHFLCGSSANNYWFRPRSWSAFRQLEFMLEYEVVFEDERVEDSADDWPVLELSNYNALIFEKNIILYGYIFK